MALENKGKLFNVGGCLSIDFGDVSGLYSAANPGGFGTPNPAITDVTAASLVLLLASGDSYTFDGGNGFFPLIPNIYGTKFQILNTSIGLSASTTITDQIVYITYTVSVGASDYVYQKYDAILCNAICCVDALLARVNFTQGCDPCNNEALKKWIKAKSLLASIYQALDCSPQMPNRAAQCLTSLTELCSDSGCSPCQ